MIRVRIVAELVSRAFVVADEPDDGRRRWFRLKEGLPPGIAFHLARTTATGDVELYFLEPGEALPPGAMILGPAPKDATPIFETRTIES